MDRRNLPHSVASLGLTMMRLLLCVASLHLLSRDLVSGLTLKCEKKHVNEKTIRQIIADDFFDRAPHRSFHMIPPLRKNLADKKSEAEKFLDNRTRIGKGFTLYGDRNCPNITDQTAPDVISRSTCPWFVYMDVDDDRLPRVMAFAWCRCKTCVGEEGKRCMPVYSYPTVLRRYCQPSGYTYLPVTERHPVGCTCTVARKRKSTTGSNA